MCSQIETIKKLKGYSQEETKKFALNLLCVIYVYTKLIKKWKAHSGDALFCTGKYTFYTNVLATK